MGEVIFQYEGTLERFLADGIMIIFNDPIPCADIPSVPSGSRLICAIRLRVPREVQHLSLC